MGRDGPQDRAPHPRDEEQDPCSHALEPGGIVSNCHLQSQEDGLPIFTQESEKCPGTPNIEDTSCIDYGESVHSSMRTSLDSSCGDDHGSYHISQHHLGGPVLASSK